MFEIVIVIFACIGYVCSIVIAFVLGVLLDQYGMSKEKEKRSGT